MFEGTIDWEAYWRGDTEAGTLPVHSTEEKTELVERFFDRTTIPATFASVGCGNASLPRTIADTHPEMEVWGFDAAEAAIRHNRQEYPDANVSFAQASLPDPEIDRCFDVVYCYGTLHYVKDTERAVQDLYSLVEDGGYLIVNYPNAGSQNAHQENTEEGTAMYRRFRLVYHGENLLTRERIATVLESDVNDYWEFVDAPDTYWTKPGNPCLFVRK